MMLENYGRHGGELARGDRREPALRGDLRVAPLRRPRRRGAGRRPRLQRRNGGSFSSGELAREYGFTDLDGSQPDCWRYMVEVQDAGLPRTRRLPLIRRPRVGGRRRCRRSG